MDPRSLLDRNFRDQKAGKRKRCICIDALLHSIPKGPAMHTSTVSDLTIKKKFSCSKSSLIFIYFKKNYFKMVLTTCLDSRCYCPNASSTEATLSVCLVLLLIISEVFLHLSNVILIKKKKRERCLVIQLDKQFYIQNWFY